MINRVCVHFTSSCRTPRLTGSHRFNASLHVSYLHVNATPVLICLCVNNNFTHSTLSVCDSSYHRISKFCSTRAYSYFQCHRISMFLSVRASDHLSDRASILLTPSMRVPSLYNITASTRSAPQRLRVPVRPCVRPFGEAVLYSLHSVRVCEFPPNSVSMFRSVVACYRVSTIRSVSKYTS